MNTNIVFTIILFAMMTIYILVKEVLIPRRNNRRGSNPINLDRFYQEFKDFKEAQCKWNDEIKEEIKHQDRRIDELEKK